MTSKEKLWYSEEAKELSLLVEEYKDLALYHAVLGDPEVVGLLKDISNHFREIARIYEADLDKLPEVAMRFGAIRSLQEQMNSHLESTPQT
jgi:hypothetical protein